MKSLLLTLLWALPFLATAAEGEKSQSGNVYRVVFAVAVDGADKWEGALRNVENALKALGPDTKIAVVAHGKGIGLLLASNSAEHAELKVKAEKLHAGGVTFAGCENTMARMKIEKKDLVGFATTVDSGVAEVIRKQTAGWAYIKAGG